MSEAIIVRRGGGFSAGSALVHVSAPVGSKVTFSKGGFIVRTINPSKAHLNAKDSEMADYYFPVSPGSYGEWAITATLGSNSTSGNVTISANKQYDVVLTYDLYLVRNGVVMDGYSAQHLVTGDYASIAAYDDYTKFLVDLTGQSINAYGYSVYFSPKVDLTAWKTLVLDCQLISVFQNYAGKVRAPAFGLASSNEPATGHGPTLETSYQKQLASATVSSLSERTTYYLDVAAAAGELYVMATIEGSSGVKNPELRVFNFYLSKDVIEEEN